MSSIKENIQIVRERMTTAERSSNRKPGETELVAVSKFHSTAAVAEAIGAGHREFGENRVQEAAEKFPSLKEKYSDITLHLIGPLQTNKARDAIRLFDVIETIDRPKLAKAVAKEMDRQDRRPKLLVQVNTGEEPQKSGVFPTEADEFIRLCVDELELPIEGLMCIPPAGDEPAMHFALLAEMARRNELNVMSMGMSADFEPAIKLGSTHVRIGTAIFGNRPAR
ncbi:MAG: YggS family pyridoxal phosphate-dependent enzyme [Rhodospirillaceae bacterium]|nr:YggS family pyridoxal phosphate-dependent enzyme [Rhodospirillaceae bacterium]